MGPRIARRAVKWSLQSREALKHARYEGRSKGRRTAPNGQLVPVVANSYGAIGREGQAFLRLVERKARVLGRESAGGRLAPLVESLVVFFTARNVLAAYGREIV